MRNIINYHVWNPDAKTFIAITKDEMIRLEHYWAFDSSNYRFVFDEERITNLSDRKVISRFYYIKSNDV